MATSLHTQRGTSCRQADDGGPSTSGRPLPVISRQQRLICRANMPQMYNTNPIKLPANKQAQGVVKGARTTATPRLTPERVMQRLAETQHENAFHHYAAFYSSELGGIVTEPGYMVLPMDDHMAHRGDAVFDSVLLVDGYLYQLDAHVARLKASAELAGILLPMPDERLRRILLDTAAASMKMNGMLTFWLSRGRGTFMLGDTNGPSLYALLSTEVAYAAATGIDRDNGFKAVISPVAPLPFYFSAVRSTSCIQQSVAQLEAQTRGADIGIFIDDEGHVLYGSDCSIAILTEDNTLVVPPDEGGLAGMAANNVADLAMQYADDDLTVDRVERRAFKVDEMKAAREAFALNSFIGAVGISHLDGEWIGTHEFQDQAGPVSLALNQMLLVDRQYKQGSDKHTEVPYGYLTGMRSQLQ